MNTDERRSSGAAAENAESSPQAQDSDPAATPGRPLEVELRIEHDLSYFTDRKFSRYALSGLRYFAAPRRLAATNGRQIAVVALCGGRDDWSIDAAALHDALTEPAMVRDSIDPRCRVALRRAAADRQDPADCELVTLGGNVRRDGRAALGGWPDIYADGYWQRPSPMRPDWRPTVLLHLSIRELGRIVDYARAAEGAQPGEEQSFLAVMAAPTGAESAGAATLGDNPIAWLLDDPVRLGRYAAGMLMPVSTGPPGGQDSIIDDALALLRGDVGGVAETPEPQPQPPTPEP